MSLSRLNRRLHLWSRSLTGRFMVLLLVAALVPGIRVAVEHAHANGSHEHAHSSQPDPDQGDAPGFDQAGEVQLHQHDLGTAASDLPPANSPQMVSVSPDRPVKRLAASRPPSSPRSPPHRPPIA